MFLRTLFTLLKLYICRLLSFGAVKTQRNDEQSNTPARSLEDPGPEVSQSDISLPVVSPEFDFIPLTVPQRLPNMPPRPEFTPFTVPYLCVSAPYDRGDFWSYPERCGWIVHAKDTACHPLCPPGLRCRHGRGIEEWADDPEREIKPHNFARENGEEVTATDKVTFLQAWLFFGVLDEASTLCGLQLNAEAEFVVDGASVCTNKLNGLSRRWFESTHRISRAGDKEVMEQVMTIARHARLMLSEELVPDSDGDPTSRFKYTYAECRVLQSIDLVIRVLGLLLLHHVYMPGFIVATDEGWAKRRVEASLEPTRYEGMDQLGNFTGGELEEKGWCESEISLMADDEMAFAALLDRPRNRDHSKCESLGICRAYQTDEETYKTRHVEDDCDCESVSVQTEALVEALQKDIVPKVIITEQSELEERMELEVIADNDYPYIAISHVWADGLGNPTINALPKCQLRRLRRYVNELYTNRESTTTLQLPVGLWMDTLCIPVDPSAKAYRKKAITMLGQTFNNASFVLVLDRELEIVESSTVSFLELGLRILCSGWMKRLWTLQEATLASEAHGAERLYFQMQDGPFEYTKYDHARKFLRGIDEDRTEIQAEERAMLIERGVILLIGEQIPSVRAMREMRRGWSPFQVAYSSLEHRTTSKIEDVPICLASLLGKDVSTIISASSLEQRMINLYVLMRDIPGGIIWCDLKSPQKITVKPFRWAPLSITDCPATTYMGWRNGTCDSSGLHVQYCGFVFTQEDAEETHGKSDGNGVARTFPKKCDIADVNTGELIAELQWRSSSTIPMQRNLALIFKPAPRVDRVRPSVAVVVVESTTRSDEEDETKPPELACKIVGYAHYIRGSKITHAHVFRGQVTDDAQRWCIT